MLSKTKSRLVVKAPFIIFIVFIGLIAISCSTTTYFNLTEDNRGSIERQLNKAEKDKDVGTEVSLLLKDGAEIYGELLSIRDSTLILCTEHSAKEEELANSTYPIIPVQNDQIQELTIEGSSYVWWGLGTGYLA